MLVCLVGRSGSGKSTIERLVSEAGYERVISYTSRAKRDGEVDGVDYKFRSRVEIERLKDAGELMEVKEYQGNLYGSPKLDINKRYVMCIELKGLEEIRGILGSNNIKVIGLEISSEEAYKRCICRGKVNSREVLERVKRDDEIFKGLRDKVDKIIDSNRSIEEVYRDVMRYIKDDK